MSSRTNINLFDRLAEELRACRADLDGLKGRQLISGDSGVLTYVTQTSAAWDYVEHFPTASNTNVRLRVTHTGDGTQDFPIVEGRSVAGISFGSDPTIYVLRPYPDTVVSGSSRGVYINANLVDYASLDATGKTRWLAWFRLTGDVTLYFKAYAYGSSPGSLLVERYA